MRKSFLFIGLPLLFLARCSESHHSHDHGDHSHDHSHDHNIDGTHTHGEGEQPHNHRQEVYTITPDSATTKAGADSLGFPGKSIQNPE